MAFVVVVCFSIRERKSKKSWAPLKKSSTCAAETPQCWETIGRWSLGWTGHCRFYWKGATAPQLSQLWPSGGKGQRADLQFLQERLDIQIFMVTNQCLNNGLNLLLKTIYALKCSSLTHTHVCTYTYIHVCLCMHMYMDYIHICTYIHSLRGKEQTSIRMAALWV